MVLKPAPDTPWSGTMLGKLIVEETDIPAGVVNIVTPADHELGEVLTSDPRVDMVTFTGSTATGRRIMASGSATLKKMFLELGGKSAYIVLDDADLIDVGADRGRHGVLARGAGLRDRHAPAAPPLALRRGRRAREDDDGEHAVRRPDRIPATSAVRW